MATSCWHGLGPGHPIRQDLDSGTGPRARDWRWVAGSGGREERLLAVELAFIVHLLCAAGTAHQVLEKWGNRTDTILMQAG